MVEGENDPKNSPSRNLVEVVGRIPDSVRHPYVDGCLLEGGLPRLARTQYRGCHPSADGVTIFRLLVETRIGWALLSSFVMLTIVCYMAFEYQSIRDHLSQQPMHIRHVGLSLEDTPWQPQVTECI